MTEKWNLIVDVAKCDNCRNCFLATKDEHIGNDFPGYAAAQPEEVHSWVDIERKERGQYPIAEAHFMPVMCNHCDDAPCMKAAKDGGAAYDGYVALGVVIRGETHHFDIVANESARALMDLSVDKRLALGNGIMTTENGEQAWERCDPARLDKGGFAARAALTMIGLKRKLGGANG